MGVGQDDVVGDLLAGGDEGQRQAVLGLQGQQAPETGVVGSLTELGHILRNITASASLSSPTASSCRRERPCRS